MDDNSPTLDIKIDSVKSEAGSYFHTLSVRKEARSRKVAVTFLNQYLIPLSSTAETIDSVYISKDVTVLFQITVTPSHDSTSKASPNSLTNFHLKGRKRYVLSLCYPTITQV
jgi:hypothetical protein